MSEEVLSPVVTEVNQTGNVREQTLYHDVLSRVKAEGLLKKNPGFYIKLLIVVSIMSVILWAGIALSGYLTGSSWVSLIWVTPMAMVLGIVTAQYGFVAHEAAHKQVFESHKANVWTGLVLANLFAGMSYGFWLNKHNRHHQKPNQLGYDPDVNLPVLSFTKAQLAGRRGVEKLLSDRQGDLLLLLLAGTSFLFVWDSIKSLIKPYRHVKYRWVEATLLTVRHAFPLVMLFMFFNPLQAVFLYLAFMLTYGVFIGGAFAPNHKGMPVLPEGTKLDFFHRQVLLSRNVSPSWWKDMMMGGLNYQVEHHLFPSMPRTSLPRAHEIVVQFCKETETPFTETSLRESFRIVKKFLDEVGIADGNADPFVCPMVASWRPRM